MRLMFIVPRRSGGGAEKVIANLASGLAEQHEVYLVSIWDPIGFPYPVSDRVKVIRLKKETTSWRIVSRVRRSLHPDQLPRLRQAKQSWDNNYLIHSLKRLKQKLRIDCAISFLTPANYLNTAAEAKCPALISIRSCLEGEYAPPEVKDPSRKETVIYSCKHADRIVSVSKEAVGGLVNSFSADPDKISVIYNPCDLEKITQLGKELPDDESILRRMEAAEFVFLSSGRITPKKGQWHLLHAFSQVLKQHPEALLVVLGKNNDEKTEQLLKAIIAEKHMEDHVILAGFHENPFAFLSRGDAFVLSSFNEGFPNALIEAMALGLPVISTDCRSGPREILAPGADCTGKTAGIDLAEYGILIPECSGNKEVNRPLEENELRMAEAMLSLLENAELRRHYSEQSLKRAGQFRVEDFLQQWDTLIQEAVVGKKHAQSRR